MTREATRPTRGTGRSRLTELLRQQAAPVHLEVKDLRAYYRLERGYVKAVDGVSFDLSPGE